MPHQLDIAAVFKKDDRKGSSTRSERPGQLMSALRPSGACGSVGFNIRRNQSKATKGNVLLIVRHDPEPDLQRRRAGTPNAVLSCWGWRYQEEGKKISTNTPRPEASLAAMEI